MQAETLKKYQTRARNFYNNHCRSESPTSAQICAALNKAAINLRPNSFATLKSALSTDQKVRGNHQTAKDIKDFINPVTAPGSTILKKPKPKKIRAVKKADYTALKQHLLRHKFYDEASAVALAYHLGVRPCEMRTITVTGNNVQIIGGKKSAKLKRGADRILVIDNPKLLKAVREAAEWMRHCSRTNAAIRDRLRKECQKTWPRRAQHPSLKSFRHQMGSNLKGSGESPEVIAYIMGHQSTKSVSVYGNRRSCDGRKLSINVDKTIDLSKIRTPEKTGRFGVENVIEKVEPPKQVKRNGLREFMMNRSAGQKTNASPSTTGSTKTDPRQIRSGAARGSTGPGFQ